MSDITTMHEAADGWVVERCRTEVLGRFARADHARLFLAALESGAEPEAAPEAAPAPAQAAPEPVSEPVSEPAPAAAAPVAAAPKSAPKSNATPDDLWAAALDRCAAGERLSAVAEATGLPFTGLRARWAGAVKAGTRCRPEPEDAPEDAPVSGGLGAVLVRGRHEVWSDEQDSEVLAASRADLADLGRRLGRTLGDVAARARVLEARAARALAEG